MDRYDISKNNGKDYIRTVEMFEHAAYEIGRFQVRIYAEQPLILRNITNFSKVEDLKSYYLYCLWHFVKDFLINGRLIFYER